MGFKAGGAALQAQHGDVSGLGKGTEAPLPQAITLPAMATGTSDSAQLRAKGVQAYGIGSFGSYGAHGNDERISVQGLGALVEFLYNAVVEIAATK